MTTNLVTGSLSERFDNQLAEAARVTSDSFVRRERQHLSLARAITFTNGVPAAISEGDNSSLQRLVEPLAANAKAQFVEVLGPGGTSALRLRLTDLKTLTYETQPMQNRGDWTIVSNVMSRREDSLGDKYAQIVQLDDGFALFTAAPIYNGSSLVGIVLVGSSLTDVLSAAKQEALADVTMYDYNGLPLATTLAVGESDETEAPEPQKPGYRQVTLVAGRPYDLLFGEIRIRNQAVGLFSIALPTSFIASAGNETRFGMGVLFGLVSLLVFITGLLIARTVTKPLLRLVATARSVSEGDLTARSGLKGPDEVGTLAASFDTMTEKLANQHLATIRALTSAIDARDPYTAGHSIRVGQLSVEIGRALELPSRDLQFLEVGGYLHDIGKIGIRDNVLLKESGLTPEERLLIESHPEIGIRIIEHVGLSQEVMQFVSSHHEKLDGTGYPLGLHDAKLTIFPRIGAVADIWDALTTDRPYRAAMARAKAIGILKMEANAGHLDERVVEAFIGLAPAWERRVSRDKALRGLTLVELQIDKAGVA